MLQDAEMSAAFNPHGVTECIESAEYKELLKSGGLVEASLKEPPKMGAPECQ